MNLVKRIAIACTAAGALLPLFALPRHPARSPKGPQPNSKPATVSSDGERIFHQNCSRCHDAPQGFSPQISGTVIRHMRMRASLSASDEQALLKFMNP